MNLLERVLLLLRANLDTLVSGSEDPEKTLKQLRQDMRNQLVQVKTQVAMAIAEQQRLKKKHQELATGVELWLKKAEAAVQQNNEAAARAALVQYNEQSQFADRYQQQIANSEQLVRTMRDALRQLEEKLREIEHNLELLEIRRRQALVQQRVFEALNQANSPTLFETGQRANDEVITEEARGKALAKLHNQDPGQQLTQLTQEQRLDMQLRELKARAQTARQSSLNGKEMPAPPPVFPQTGEAD